MGVSFNQVTIAGNLTREPELRYLQSGTAVCDFSVAINERYKNQSGEWVEAVVFADVTAFARTAEVLSEYCHKGSPVLVSGKLKTDSWETNDGQKRSKMKVVANILQLLGSKGDGDGSPRRGSAQSQPEQHDEPATELAGPVDELPF